MPKYRRNAVVIDFNVMPVRPDIESVSKFITNDLKLDLKRLKNVQLNNTRNHVIIELGSPEEASDLVDHHNLKHKVGCRGQAFRIPVFLEDNSIQVRVHDLPPHLPNELIATHLEAYGEVNSIRREVWRDITTTNTNTTITNTISNSNRKKQQNQKKHHLKQQQ
ncbi:uncharacterized protein LOC120424453 [Culex pipiens pallens]|uniref:uncharacterized protein LOC120424453 n=1 Tax=Culex pipiens pallens TaxID=42434 RepID=UPI001954AB9C|nr:uncharacterized protein LOC120424453 [Culex pipiens pallens]